MIENLKLKKVNAPKDLPLLASLSMAVPILIGLLSNNLKLGMTASLAAILVVYFPLKGSFSEKILMLMGCSFGFISVYTIGLIFSFNTVVSVIVFGITAGIIHWMVSHFKLKPPKDFFFVMICSNAISIPHQPIHKIAENIGYIWNIFEYSFRSGIFFKFDKSVLGSSSLYRRNARKFNSTCFPKKCSKNSWDFNRSRFLLGNTFICKKSMGNMFVNNNPPIYCRIFSSKKLWNSNDFYNATYNFFVRSRYIIYKKSFFICRRETF